MPDKNEIKSLLRDWMTATTQLSKVHNQRSTVQEISEWWNIRIGIRMNERWVERALYGKNKSK